LSQSQIYKVLSILKKHKVKALLIGGQAAILYGASEFSRDIDFAILLDQNNLHRIELALRELKAEQIYFPSLQMEYLERGHACHFRCKLPEIYDFRVDIMGKLRGCEDFEVLWKRREIITVLSGINVNVISLSDLVQSKKTQRDKDWYMIKRLVEADILHSKKISKEKLEWWFMECRTPELLIDLANKYPIAAKKNSKKRPSVKYAIKADISKLSETITKEEKIERKKDVKYWAPLKKELEEMRRIKQQLSDCRRAV
jgi:hypothetical protein